MSTPSPERDRKPISDVNPTTYAVWSDPSNVVAAAQGARAPPRREASWGGGTPAP